MKQNKIPMRRCIGCMESKPKRELIRVVASGEEGLRTDPSGKANGRGAYLCLNPECVEKARKRKAFTRNLDISVKEEEIQRVVSEIVEIIDKETQRTNR
jgi:uncharacterized protein